MYIHGVGVKNAHSLRKRSSVYGKTAFLASKTAPPKSFIDKGLRRPVSPLLTRVYIDDVSLALTMVYEDTICSG